MNLFEVTPSGDTANIGGYAPQIPLDVVAQAGGGSVLVGIRPEDLRLSESGIPMTVMLVEALGADTYVYGAVETTSGTVTVVSRAEPSARPALGSAVHVVPEKMHFFSTTGNQARL